MVTGGYNSERRVTQYSLTGEVTKLPDLNTKRRGHACSKFVNTEGVTVSYKYKCQKMIILIFRLCSSLEEVIMMMVGTGSLLPRSSPWTQTPGNLPHHYLLLEVTCQELLWGILYLSPVIFTTSLYI